MTVADEDMVRIPVADNANTTNCKELTNTDKWLWIPLDGMEPTTQSVVMT